MFCYVSAILVVVDMDTCSADTGLRAAWQWELGAFTLTVTWLNLLSLLRSEKPYLTLSVSILSSSQESPLLWDLCCDGH